MTSLKSLLRDAQARGNVAQNVGLSIKRVDADGRGKKRLKIGEDIPSADEIKALIAAMPDNRWRPMLLTAIFTGLGRASCGACAGPTLAQAGETRASFRDCGRPAWPKPDTDSLVCPPLRSCCVLRP
jgi:hypothetical protein